MSATTGVEGVDAEAVTAWLADRVPALEPPLAFSLIAGGHSNLSYLVTDTAARRWVLRRPPLGHVLATAHDMSREHRIISALEGHVPVAPAVGLSPDDAVNGAPFYVMDFVEGTVVRDVADAEALTLEQRATASTSLVEVLAAIHAVDIDRVGLGDLGRREAYLERQLRRWHGQWEKSRTRDLAVVDEVHRRLVEGIPPQGPATIVHGDYRLDNCMLDGQGRIAAVLDWELCTLGDPMADLGLLCVYWADPGEPTHSGMPAATTLEGFHTKAALITRYADMTGRDVSRIGYYVAFGYWKLACIIQGVFARYSAGAMGDRGDVTGFDIFGQQVEMLAEAARHALDTID